MSLVTVSDLSVDYETDTGAVHALDRINFDIEKGETIGLVGESGCGKTTLAKSILCLLDDNGKITNGQIKFKGDAIYELSEKQLRKQLRWKEISYIPQNAMAALDPVYTVGKQVDQVIQLHTDKSKQEARERTNELFKRVDLPANLVNDYPHELSGGQRQRVTIALALALDPDLIIADEPTTGLDVIVQDQIIKLINEIKEDIDCSIVFVTHDMSVVADIADRVLVMYAGRAVEIGTVDDIFDTPSHPYTIGLQNAFPQMEENPTEDSLIEIPGSPPDLQGILSEGCRFASRCPFATKDCVDDDPEMISISDGHEVRCIYPEKAADFRSQGKSPEMWRRNSNQISTHQ